MPPVSVTTAAGDREQRRPRRRGRLGDEDLARAPAGRLGERADDAGDAVTRPAEPGRAGDAPGSVDGAGGRRRTSSPCEQRVAGGGPAGIVPSTGGGVTPACSASVARRCSTSVRGSVPGRSSAATRRSS